MQPQPICNKKERKQAFVLSDFSTKANPFTSADIPKLVSSNFMAMS